MAKRRKLQWIQAWPEESGADWNVSLVDEDGEVENLRSYSEDDVDEPEWRAWKRAKVEAKARGMVCQLKDGRGLIVDAENYEPEVDDD